MFVVIQCCVKTGNETELGFFPDMPKAYKFLLTKQAQYPELEFYILPDGAIDNDQFRVYIVDGFNYNYYMGNLRGF